MTSNTQDLNPKGWRQLHVVAIVFGRKNSQGLPGKNLWPVLGRPLAVYPLLAARHAASVTHIYISTDSEELARLGASFGARWLPRPQALADNQALLEDAMAAAYRQLLVLEPRVPDIVVALLANAATVPPGAIDDAVRRLHADPSLDSVATVTRWNQYTPARARVIGRDGLLKSFLPDEQLVKATCDRNTAGDIYFVDAALSVVRPRALEHLHEGLAPFRWLGRRIWPMIQQGGLDVDDEEGLVLTEHWLRRHGFTETTTPYEASGASVAVGKLSR